MNLESIRRQTPICTELLHFNNAGASLQAIPVQNAILEHLALEQTSGGYEAAAAANLALENYYQQFAKLLNCHPAEIAWADSASHAWNTLIHAIDFKPGDKVLTGQNEYASNVLMFLHLQKRLNIEVQIIPNDSTGAICLEALERAIDKRVKLISLTHIASHNGTIQPAAQVGDIANRHGVFFILDACQSVGQLHLDVDAIGCHMLTGTGRKYLRGPRGTGFLYINQNIMTQLTPSSIDLHSAKWTDEKSYVLRADARRFESFEHFVAGKLGLTEAVEYALSIGTIAIEERNIRLGRKLRQTLSEIDGVTVHDQGSELGAIVSFSSAKESAPALHQRLQERQINTSIIKAENCRIDSSTQGLGNRNRASIHYYNTEEEIAIFCAAVAEGP
ncbi:MAG: aminotransferase class V-fold PLP-dependent enzyme [Pseudohongiellaceae bacterium]|nr:aminotransferase class V-fold PLP-dependent enzyme [Pseudohongiellaceae bacterium]